MNKKYGGNVPIGEKWKRVGSVRLNSIESYDVYYYKTPESKYVTCKMILPEGKKSTKGNFWFGLDTTNKFRLAGRDLETLLKNNYTLFEKLVCFIDENIEIFEKAASL